MADIFDISPEVMSKVKDGFKSTLTLNVKKADVAVNSEVFGDDRVGLMFEIGKNVGEIFFSIPGDDEPRHEERSASTLACGIRSSRVRISSVCSPRSGGGVVAAPGVA